MPFIEEENIGDFNIPVPERVFTQKEEGGLLGAVFEEGQVLTNVAPYLVGETLYANDYDPNYDFLEDIKGTKYEPYIDNFKYVYNSNRADWVKTKIDREEANWETINNNGAWGYTALLGTSMLDPVGLYAFGKVGLTNNYLQNAKNLAKASAIGAVTTEVPLGVTKELYTSQDVAVSVGGAAVLGSVLGAGLTPLMRSKLEAGLTKELAAEVTPAEELGKAQRIVEGSVYGEGVGAAKVDDTTLAQNTLIAEKYLGPSLTPGMRLARSPFNESRKMLQNLSEFAPEFEKAKEGIAQPIAAESLIEANLGKQVAALADSEVIYKEYRQATKGTQNLSPAEFNKAVGRAMFNNDIGENEYISRAAKAYREKLFNPLRDEAIDMGLLPPDVKPQDAASYFSVMYDKNKVRAGEKRFKAIVREWVEQQKPAILKQLSETKTEEAALQARLLDDPKYADDVADEIYSTITGLDDVRPTFELKVDTRGPLKEKVFHIPTNKIMEFLDTDVSRVSERYAEVMSREIALQRNFGTRDFAEAKVKLDDELRIKKQGLKDNDPKKELLEKRYEADKEDLQFLWDKVRGTFRSATNPDDIWVQGARIARNLNYVSLMGGQTISSMADVGNIAIRNGYLKTFEDGLIPMVKSLVGDGTALKVARQELREMGIVVEGLKNSRMASMFDLDDNLGRGSKFERGTRNMTRIFSKITLMNWWNDTMKTAAALTAQAQILRNSEKILQGKALTNKALRKMASAGLDKDMMRRIATQARKYGKKESGIRVSNAKMWDDAEARRVYQAVLAKEVRSTIVTPTSADKPIFMNTEIGKTLTQFKSFAIASHQRLLIPAIQNADAKVLEGISAGVMMGMLIYYLKETLAGRKVSDNPAVWVAEGIDRSGLISVVMEAHNTTEKLTGLGLSRLTGSAPMSRYASRSGLESVLGPTFGRAGDMVQVAHAMSRGEMSDSDIRTLRRLMPAQNLFYLRWLFDSMEEAAK